MKDLVITLADSAENVGLRSRLHAAGFHLALSLFIAGLAALIVFGLWYPYPYREVSGGRELFILLVTVDVISGPLLTATVFNLAKRRSELCRDIAIVGLLQIGALVYGLWTMAVARPVHLVFEIDRFRVVHAVDVPDDLLARTAASIKPLPWTGPSILAVRPFAGEQEKMEATLAALQGLDLGVRPDLWEPYAQAAQRAVRAAKPVAELSKRFPTKVEDIDSALREGNRTADSVSYLPMIARKSYWTVLIDRETGSVLGFVPIDSF